MKNALWLCVALVAFMLASSAEAQPKAETPQERTARERRERENAEAATAVAGTLSVFAIFSFACIGVVGIFLNFIPIMIAAYRGHPDTAPIAILTIFLGCTGIGWWIALIWAVKSFPRDHKGHARDW